MMNRLHHGGMTERKENETMKRNLTLKENIVVASMLFGLFFGAGNLIFPVSMGQQAGSRMWPAFFGFFITGVGLPIADWSWL